MTLPIRILILILASMLALPSLGAALWQQLPPTPPLPPHGQSASLQVQGATLWYSQWGDKQSPPVLLLHGGYANSNYYGHLIPVLVSSGYRVIAMDSRGHGRSRRSAAPLTYDQMAGDVIALLDRLQIHKVSLVGWSDGGCIGYDLAIHHPDRLQRLFTFGANADPSGAREDAGRNPLINDYLRRVREEYRVLSPTPKQWSSFDAAVGTMWATLPHFTTEQLRAIRIPTTVADGAYDEAVKQEHVHYIAQTIPDARLVILPGVSHFAMLQDPQAFAAAVLKFLRD